MRKKRDKCKSHLDTIFIYPIVCTKCGRRALMATKKADLSRLSCHICGSRLVYQTRKRGIKRVRSGERNNKVRNVNMELNPSFVCYGNGRTKTVNNFLGEHKMAKINFESLNKVLPCQPAKKGSKKRKVSSGSRNDAVSDALAKCTCAADVANFGMRFGLTEVDVRARAKKAPNFGQYRMVMGNLARGVVNRIAIAREKGQKLTVAMAAYPKNIKKTKKVVKKKKKKSSHKK